MIIKKIAIRLYSNVVIFLRKRIRPKLIKKFEKSLQKRYSGGDITIISNTCLGGIVYHQLGLKFCSPTINLWIEFDGFLDFCSHLKDYLDEDIVETNLECNYPVGMIKPKANLNPVIIHFNHYSTFEEAISKWNERKKRILWDKIFVFMDASTIPVNNVFIRKWNRITNPKIAFGYLNIDNIDDYYYIDFHGPTRPTLVLQYEKKGRLYLNQVNYVEVINQNILKK